MKNLLLLTIISCMMISSIISNSEARPSRTDQELIDSSDMVFVGKIISKNTNFKPGYISYEINVEKSLKNPPQNNVITAVGHNLSGGLLGNTIFEVDDTGMFYLNNYSQKYDNVSNWFISPYSYKIDSSLEQRRIIQEIEDYQNLILISVIGIPALAITIGFVIWNNRKKRNTK